MTDAQRNQSTPSEQLSQAIDRSQQQAALPRLPEDLEELKQYLIGDTGVSVGELLDCFMVILDGEPDHDIEPMVGPAEAGKIIEVRQAIQHLWRDSLG